MRSEMPTYEYKCEDEDKVFEVFQSMMDDPLTECPECNGTVRRLISRNVGISFKGGGFYSNDSQSTPAEASSNSSGSEASS
mgnify:CR=1 FL=1